jgi:Uma2 family endonuclease
MSPVQFRDSASGVTFTAMSQAPPSEDTFTAERYLALVESGVLGPEDKVELLEGVIVAVAPQGVRHAAAVARANHVLVRIAGDRAHIRPQLPLVAGEKSVPEPDLALVAGPVSTSDRGHPRGALLVVEVAESSLAADRLTKSRIYAAAGIAEYWIVNLRDDRIEVFRNPDAGARCYQEHRLAQRGDSIELAALPAARVAVDDLLPAREL